MFVYYHDNVAVLWREFERFVNSALKQGGIMS